MAAVKPLQQEQLSPQPLKFGWRNKPAGPRPIVARGLARPEPNLDKLGHVLLEVAKQTAAAEQAKQEADKSLTASDDQDAAA